MFTLGPHHREAFEKDARQRLIAQAIIKLGEQGFEARYDLAAQTLIATGKGQGPETLLFSENLDLAGYRRPSGATTRFEPFDAGKGTRTISPAGTVTEMHVSDDGRAVELNQPGLAEYRLVYDMLGRPESVTYPGGAHYRFEWGPENAPTRLVDRVGAEWRWTRDETSKNSQVMRDPLGREIRIDADDAGSLRRLVDAQGRETQFEFGEGRLDVKPAAGPHTTFLLQQEKAIDVRWGKRDGVRYELDDRDEIAAATNLTNGDRVAFERDQSGRLLKETSARGEFSLAYDDAGRLQAINPSVGSSVGYEYDLDGRVVAIAAWDGYRVSLRWDGDDRLVGVSYPGGVVEQRILHASGRMSVLEVRGSDGKPVLRQEYGYDAQERLTDLTERLPAFRGRRYQYDAESHVVSEDAAGSGKPLIRWKHDLKGNIMAENDAPFGIALDDRPLSVAGRPIAWNDQGCATRLPSSAAMPSVELHWTDGQLLESARPEAGAEVRFDYDPVGRRIAKRQGQRRTDFVWCRHQVVRETVTDGTGDVVVREWLYLPDSYVPLAMREVRRGVASHYSVHQDVRGAVIGLCDKTGKLVWHGQYDAFGQCQVAIDTVAQPWRLAGQYADPETGLHYNQARYFSPAYRTYLARDPRWLEWEATNYSYARNDPWNRVDPGGGFAFLVPMAIGAVVGGVMGGIAAAASGGNILAGVAGGALGGAIGAIPGAGLLLGVLAGAVGSAVTDITSALMGGKEIVAACVLNSALSGAIGGLLGAGVGKLMSKAAGALKPAVSKVAGAMKKGLAKAGAKASNSMKAATDKVKKLFSKSQICKTVPAPVSLATGEKLLIHQEFSLTGRIPIDWTRRYLSSDTRDGWFGQGWTCAFSLELHSDTKALHFYNLEGRDLPLPHVANGDKWMDPLEEIAIERDAQGQYAIRDKDSGLRFLFEPLPGAVGQFRLGRIQDRNGNAIRLTYPAATDIQAKLFVHRPQMAADANGRTWHFTWDERAHLTSLAVTLPTDRNVQVPVARYAYSPEGDLRSAAVFDTRQFKYAWDHHILVEYVLPDGARFRQEWDKPGPDGKCIRSYAVDGTVDDRIEYRDGGKQTIHTDILGRVTRYDFDEHHIHVGTVDAAGNRTATKLDPNGNPMSAVDALGRETQTIYDARGNLVYVKDAAGAETQVEYSALDMPVRMVDPLGQVWARAYDDRGNLVSAVDPLGQETRYEYDARGQLVRVVDAKGGAARLEWSASGELVAYTDCSAKVTRFEYDAWGRTTANIDALNQVTRYLPDPFGRVIEQRDADGVIHRLEWDAMDRLTAYTDPLGAVTSYRYDIGGRPVARRNALGFELRYEYDKAGRLATLVNEKADRYRLQFDELDRLVQEIGFDGRVQRYVYNPAGELTHLIEPGGSDVGPGKVAHFGRDAVGRLIRQLAGGDAVDFEYDPLGRILKAANPVATTTFAYDLLDNLLAEEQNIAIPGIAPRKLSLAYSYDSLGNRTETILPSGRKVSALYYGTGHLHGLLLDGEVLSNLERDDLHRETSRTQGVLKTDFAYDPQGRLTRTRTGATQTRGVGLSIDRRYRYDLAGRLTERADTLRRSAGTAATQRQFAYQHDIVGQLLGARISGAQSLTELFAFDPAGNLLPGEASGSGRSTGLVQGNRLLVFQDMRFAYDVYGNVVEKRKGAEQRWEFAYDASHRLIQSTVLRNGATQTTGYFYDAFGRRVAKQDDFGATLFGWDGNRMVHEARGSKISEYVFEPDSFVPFAKVDVPSAAPVPAGVNLGTAEVYYFQNDQIGTPQELTNSAGQGVWAATPRAWGNVLLKDLEEVDQPIRFQGQYRDEETGLHYNRHRYYDPDAGRYASCDPIGLRGGQNVYAYGAGDPTLWVDALGLEACKVPSFGAKGDGATDPIVWPPNRGFAGEPASATLIPGAKIDRYGAPSGTFVAPEGTPFQARSLPDSTLNKPLTVYEVVKPIDVQAGPAAPWFGKSGGGLQFELPDSIKNLLDSGHLKQVRGG